ncbi:GPI anchored serine-threonine rich protein [Xylogone sp. PMI_703]|nr:GPI anchored serine-threonine rich protein [Xylogone sp. PMI_703]
MRTSFVSTAFLALVSSVFAQTPGFDVITNPTQDKVVKVGQTLDITWEPSSVTGTATIILLQGATPSTLQLGQTVAASIKNQAGKFSWTIPASVGNFQTYGFKIQLDSDPNTFQYSFPFHIVSGGSTTTTTTPVHISTTSAAATSSSAQASSAVSTTESASTKTLTLSHGTGYTTTTIAVVTSTASCNTHLYNSTVATSSYTPVTSAASNGTLSTTLVLTKTPVGFPSKSPTPPTSAPSSVPSEFVNSATNIARGGMAVLGGIAIALFM